MSSQNHIVSTQVIELLKESIPRTVKISWTDADARIGHQARSVFPFSGDSGLNVIWQGLRSEAARVLDGPSHAFG